MPTIIRLPTLIPNRSVLVFARIFFYFTLTRYVNVLMSHVRFPMMSHHQLVELLLHPVSKSHTNMIVEKIREGLRFHKGKEEIGPTTDNRIYTPRLYTTEKFCASLSVDHFYELPSYHCRSLLFSSQRLACPHLSSWVQWWISKAKGLWKWPEKGSRPWVHLSKEGQKMPIRLSKSTCDVKNYPNL